MVAGARAQTHIAADLGRQVLAAGLDANECYRVRDVEFSEQDARVYLTEGYLIFGKPVNGAPVTAVFSGNVDGGDAEVILLPQDRSERKSLAAYTGTPNLDEHFRSAVFIFTEPEARALRDKVRSSGAAKNLPDIGALLAEQYGRTVADIESSYESRIVLDLLSSGHSGGFFEAVLEGRKLGNFDFLYDSRAPENLLGGQIAERNGRTYWDTWFSYASGPNRTAPPVPEEQIIDYKIEASLDSALVLHCATSIHFKATAASSNVIPFDLSGQMRATSARVDGQPAEVYERDSLRAGLVQNTGNELLLVIPPKPLDAGSEHTLRIEHEGKVVLDAGNRVYYVSARGTWYPGRGLQFAKYDVTYRYPANLDLVAAGRIVEDRREGDTHITRRAPAGPIRLLGLNLGQFERKSAERAGIRVNAYANRSVEEALRPRPQPPPDTHIVPATPFPSRRRSAAPPLPDDAAPVAATPSPAGHLSEIATELANELAFYKTRFGDPALPEVEATPIPGRFGQGFAGIIYLPTLTYFIPEQTRSVGAASLENQRLFRTLLRAHEAAHQWWGNVVAVASYHNEWLMEALSSYSALLYLESSEGPKAAETVLEDYRRNLLQKGPDGLVAEAEGPVVQGRRLESSNNPSAWVAIMYGKGTWIIHMLRRRMGDPQFLAMLADLRKRYEWKTLDNEAFRAECARFLPPHADDPKLERFFDSWVYGTGVPELKLSYSVKGRPGAYRLTGTVAQSGVPDDFSVTVPVEIQTGRGAVKTIQVVTASDPVSFSVPVSAAVAKAVLDPHGSVLKK